MLHGCVGGVECGALRPLTKSLSRALTNSVRCPGRDPVLVVPELALFCEGVLVPVSGSLAAARGLLLLQVGVVRLAGPSPPVAPAGEATVCERCLPAGSVLGC